MTKFAHIAEVEGHQVLLFLEEGEMEGEHLLRQIMEVNGIRATATLTFQLADDKADEALAKYLTDEQAARAWNVIGRKLLEV
jgi:hypothetical protein